MNAVCKVDRSRTGRKILHIPCRCETVYLLCKQIQVRLNGTHEFFIVIRLLLPLQDLTQPCQLRLFLLFSGAALHILLIFPMGCNTVFRSPVHIKRPDLDLKRLTGRSDQSCMKRLIHIGFRHCNVVFKPPWNRSIHLMNDSQRRITVPHSLYLDPDCKYIINLVQRLMLIHHFLINTEEMFYTAINLCRNICIINMFLNILNNTGNECFPLCNSFIDLSCQILINLRHQIFQ